MKILSIILPVYNEEDTILSILQRIENTKSNNIVYEVIVINDGSSDNTSKILKDNKSLYKYLINNDKNMGKGFSVKEGLKLATGEYIIFQDADLEYDPLEIEKFINVINNFNPDIVLGSRFNYDKYIRSYNLLNKIANIIITNFFNIFYNTTFTDVYCCYACFKKDLLDFESLTSNGFEQHAEILCKVIKKGSKFFEVPINYNGRSISEGKKIRFYHMIPILFQIVKGRFF